MTVAVIVSSFLTPYVTSPSRDPVETPDLDSEPQYTERNTNKANRLFQLLLGAELVGVTALLLTAVGGTGRKTSLSRRDVSFRYASNQG